MSRRALVAAIGCALALLPACSTVKVTKTLDTGQTAGQISRNLASAFSIAPPPVACPKGVTVKVGQAFTCTTRIDGQPLDIRVTLDDAQGGFTPRVQEAVIELDKVERELQGSDAAATVHCDPAPSSLLVDRVGDSFTCTRRSTTATVAYRVTVKDLEGTVSFDEVAAP